MRSDPLAPAENWPTEPVIGEEEWRSEAILPAERWPADPVIGDEGRSSDPVAPAEGWRSGRVVGEADARRGEHLQRRARVPLGFSQALRAALARHAPAFDPGRPGVRVLLLIGLAAALAGGVHAWRSQPVAEPLPPRPTAAAAPVSASAPAASPPAGLIVHVTGKVRRPGVHTLPDGSRVTDAVSAAGGATKKTATDSLNLARRLIDGEQIVVGGPNTSLSLQPSGAPGSGAPIDLNTATVEQLDVLPGLGEVLARRIVEHRDTHGGFRTVEQLQDVSGIGPSKYADIKDKVRV